MIRLIATVVTALMVLAVLVFFAAGFSPSDRTPPADSVAEAQTGDEEEGSVIVERDRSGQFRLEIGVNNDDALFLVDTGADLVALGPDEAERLGIEFDESTFEPVMQTASGTANGQVTRVERLTIGGRELDDVEVAVIEGLESNLLGQSALRRMGRVSIHGDKMIIGR